MIMTIMCVSLDEGEMLGIRVGTVISSGHMPGMSVS